MAEIYPWDDGRVLKRFRQDLPSNAEHEFRIARIAHERGAATPSVFEIVRVGDRPGILYERVNGVSLLKVLGERPWQVKRLARQFAELHHTVHHCLVPELDAAHLGLRRVISQRDELTPANKTALLNLLDTLPNGDALLHGDFHPDNVMITPEKMLIVDWPNAARGCPITDVARTMILLRIGEPLEMPLFLRILLVVLRYMFRNAYIRAYFARSPYAFADLAAWEPILAAHRLTDEIPGEAEKLVRFIDNRLSNLG